MSFKEMLQALAMLVPTLLLMLAAVFSLSHAEDPSPVQLAAEAVRPQMPAQHARARFDATSEREEE